MTTCTDRLWTTVIVQIWWRFHILIYAACKTRLFVRVCCIPVRGFSHTWKIALYRWTTPNNGLGKLNDHRAIKINHQRTIRGLYYRRSHSLTECSIGWRTKMFHCRMNSAEVAIYKGKDLSGHSNRQHFFAHFHPMIILSRYSKVTRSNFSHGAQQIKAHLVFPETIGLMCICACASSVSFFVFGVRVLCLGQGYVWQTFVWCSLYEPWFVPSWAVSYA